MTHSLVTRSFLFIACLVAITLPSFGQVTVELLDASATTGSVGTPFTFNIAVDDTTGTFKLDSYELTLAPETSTFAATTALGTPNFAIPSAISSIYTFAGQSGDTSGGYSGTAANDLTISSTPVVILTATFTPTTAGSYYVGFTSYGAATNSLYAYASGSSTPVTGVSEVGLALVVAPEPATFPLIIGSGLLLALGSWRSFRTARATA